ncbi:hypothetical protein RM11_1205 [Bartonella quintana RM-11]|nr:hypothetical protein RM11_1205 [Bartonella quintana RM-11]
MLAQTRIISQSDYEKIVHSLKLIRQELENGTFVFSRKFKDIHMNIEVRLAELIGPIAGRLHTARSRNDQVAVDFRLWVRDTMQKIVQALKGLIELACSSRTTCPYLYASLRIYNRHNP